MRALRFVRTFRHANVLAAVTAAAALVLVGCGAGQSTGPTTGTRSKAASGSAAAGPVLNVVGTEYSFAPSKLTASAGPTTIRFTNRGTMEHDFVIRALHVHLMAKPGKSAEATVDLAPGRYDSTCSVPGHTENGMHATLTVS